MGCSVEMNTNFRVLHIQSLLSHVLPQLLQNITVVHFGLQSKGSPIVLHLRVVPDVPIHSNGDDP